MGSKKGQLELGQAPAVVVIIGLLFLVMATIAFIGEKYGTAIESSSGTTSATVTNETGAYINATGYTLDKASVYGFTSPVITAARNATDGTVIGAGNYTLSSAGILTNATTTTWSDVQLDYTYSYFDRTTAFNTTADLQTEISANTSIAGIVLTITLVGIILTILIGVFIGLKRPRI